MTDVISINRKQEAEDKRIQGHKGACHKAVNSVNETIYNFTMAKANFEKVLELNDEDDSEYIKAKKTLVDINTKLEELKHIKGLVEKSLDQYNK